MKGPKVQATKFEMVRGRGGFNKISCKILDMLTNRQRDGRDYKLLLIYARYEEVILSSSPPNL